MREPSWCGNNPAPRPKPATPHTTGNGSFAVQKASPAHNFSVSFALNLSQAVGQRLSKLNFSTSDSCYAAESIFQCWNFQGSILFQNMRKGCPNLILDLIAHAVLEVL